MKKVLISLVIALGLTACGKSETNSQPTVQTAKPDWRYGENVDKMTGKVTKWAMSDSTNKVSMKFPHSGGSEATIVVFEKDVKVHISKGQVMCSSYSGCTIQVKFDDEKPVAYEAVGPSNGQYSHVYLVSDQYAEGGRGAKKFMTKLKTAKRVMISLEVYQENTPVWEFNVAGLQQK